MAYNAGASSGNRILIEKKTASAQASLDFTTGISNFDRIEIEFYNFLNATNTQSLQVRLSTDGGSSYAATGYGSIIEFGTSAPGIGGSVLNTGLALTLSQENGTAAFPASGIAKIFSLQSTSIYKTFISQTVHNHSSGTLQICVSANYAGVIAVNAIQLIYASGNITSGTAYVYGIQD